MEHSVDRSGISRRTFLHLMSKGAGMVGAGLFLPFHLEAAIQPLQGSSGKPKRVLILGAGLAGLAAAWELTEAGHDVTVLEARTRPGGRVHTLRDPFADGLHAEAGAVAFSSSYTHAIRYIEALGLERGDWAFLDLPGLHYLRGRRFTVRPNEPADWPYDLTEEERRLGPFGIVQRYLLDTLPPEARDPEAWNRAHVRELDRMTLGEHMRAQGASPAAVELVRDTMWFGAAVEGGSALSSVFSDLGLFMGGVPFVLTGGNDQLPTRMADRLGRNIRYGVEVVSIRDAGDTVEVRTRRGDQLETQQAERVICTIPATVLRTIEFDPVLPVDKRTAIANLPYLDYTRTYIQVGRGFWFDEGVTAFAPTDLGIGDILRQPSHDVGGPQKRAILEAQTIGPEARRLAARPDSEIIDEVLHYMEMVHPGVREHQEGGTVWAWSRDPYAMGCVSWPAPGDVLRFLEPLQRSWGRVHFAGEHTTILRSTMEGAIRSGIRAAHEVNDCHLDRPVGRIRTAS